MQFSSLLLGIAALTTASALPSVSTASAVRRAYTYTPTVSDPGFYAYSAGGEGDEAYFEDQILQFFNDATTGSVALVARFPVGFAVTQNHPLVVDAYTRTSAGIGSKIGSFGPLSVTDGKVDTAVDVVVANLTLKSSYTFEFRVNTDVYPGSIAFFDDGLFIRSGTA